MKLWPPRFIASARPNPTLNRADVDPADPIGASGTLNFDGFLQQAEYNPDLRGRDAIEIYERMRRSDSTVRETLWHIYSPILNADWTVVPPPHPSELEQEVTAFIRSAFFDWLDEPFPQYLMNAVTYLPFGHAVFEPVFQVVERSLRVEYTDSTTGGGGSSDISRDRVDTTAAAFPVPSAADGQNLPPLEVPIQQAREVEKRQYVTWRKFMPILPTTITEWHVDRSGDLTGIKQFAPVKQGDGSMYYEEIDIDAAHLLVYTNEKWGDEHTGMSLLRAAYKPWIFKELIEKIAGIAYERHGVGIPLVFMPRSADNDQAQADRMEEMLSELRAGEASFMIFPGPEAMGNNDGYTFKIASPDGGIPDFKTILEYFRGEIKGALLARFSELGHATTGARATANVQAEVWYNALHAIARYIADVNGNAIRRLVDLNYPNVERYPRLMAQNIEARNLLEFAQAVALLSNSNALAIDNPTSAWIRRTIDAPEEDPKEAKMRAEQQLQQKEMERMSLAGIETDPTETARPRVSKSATDT